jgi:hypothetical protein
MVRCDREGKQPKTTTGSSTWVKRMLLHARSITTEKVVAIDGRPITSFFITKRASIFGFVSKDAPLVGIAVPENSIQREMLFEN